MTLAADDEQPGSAHAPWDGKGADGAVAPEGPWRFAVTATDDRGVDDDRRSATSRSTTRSARSRRLALQPAVATAAFQLTRAASVTVDGRAPERDRRRDAPPRAARPGADTVAWDGRGANGKAAPGGGYQVQSTRRAPIGDVALVAPSPLTSRARH